MKKYISAFLFFTCFYLTSSFALSEQDHGAINGIIDNFTNAWNHNEGKGSADHYTSDADFINIFGMAFSSKEAIEDRHVKIHETFLKGSIFKVVDVKLKEITSDVVSAQVYWEVSGIKQSPVKALKDTINGIFTHTFVKNNDRWEIASTQNTLSTHLRK